MNQLKVFGMSARSGRWVFIPLCMIVMLCLGTVYSWSIFRKPLEDLLKIGATSSLLPFTIFLVLYAVLMPITGFYIDRYGPRTITASGGIVMGLGYILSGLVSSLPLLVLTYGAIAGAGVGIAYGVPLSVAAKWFPDKKGLALGLTVLGFGLSPLITAPLAKSLIDNYGVRPTFMILGVGFLIILLGVASLLQMPPRDWQAVVIPSSETSHSEPIIGRNVKEMLQTPTFYGLWLCYIICGFVGLSAIGISSPVAQEIIQLDQTTAAMSVSLFAVFNGLGRILFGWLTDCLKPKRAAIITYVLILIASILMLNAGPGDTLSYLVAFSLFWLCLGGWLALAPTATLSYFQAPNYAKNYGIVFTAYGLGALLGTLIGGWIRDALGTYNYVFYPTAILAVLGVFIAIFWLKPLSTPAKRSLVPTKTH